MEREKTGRGRSNSNYKHVFARIDREIVDKFGIGFFYQPPGTVQTFNNCACLCLVETSKQKKEKKNRRYDFSPRNLVHVLGLLGSLRGRNGSSGR